jgi:hypothetical protein
MNLQEVTGKLRNMCEMYKAKNIRVAKCLLTAPV